MSRVLYARFTALPGSVDEVGSMLAELVEHVRSEPGNVQFDAWLEDETRTFFVYEVYDGDRAFEAHIGADYVGAFNARLGSLIEEPRSILTRLHPLPGTA